MQSSDKTLLDDIAYLRTILYQVLEEQVGIKLLKVIEDLSASSNIPVKGINKPSLSHKLFKKVQKLTLGETGRVIQVYSINFQLINLAEENFGMQDRRATQRKGLPISGSL